MDDIAAKLTAIIREHGPRSVALYAGMGLVPFVASTAIASGWLKGIGSQMFFTAGSIDKPGILIALAHHGMWQAGQPRFETAVAWLLVGINPVISKSPGFPGQNPGRLLKDMAATDVKLIVIDPRVTETARRAHIHIQPRPGEDAAILAALIHAILDEGLEDKAFVAAIPRASPRCVRQWPLSRLMTWPSEQTFQPALWSKQPASSPPPAMPG